MQFESENARKFQFGADRINRNTKFKKKDIILIKVNIPGNIPYLTL